MDTATANPFELINRRFDVLENYLRERDKTQVIALSPTTQEEPILIEEAAELLKKSVSTLYGWTQTKKIPFSKRGNTLYFFKSQLLKWVSDGYVKTCYEVQQEAANYISAKAKK